MKTKEETKVGETKTKVELPEYEHEDTKIVSGKILARYFKLIGHKWVSRYQVDQEAEYDVGWVNDSASYEQKKDFWTRNEFKKTRSLVHVPKAMRENTVVKQILFTPVSDEKLEKAPIAEVLTFARLKTRKSAGTGKRGRKAVPCEHFDKWVEVTGAEKVKASQVKIGMGKLHATYMKWCVKNMPGADPVNYGKFWVVMKKAGLHQATRVTKATQTKTQVAV